MKIVLNKCFGGFSISVKCAELMAEMGNKQAANELKEWKQSNTWIKYYLKHGTWPKGCPKDRQGSLAIDAKYSKHARFFGFGYTKGFDGGYPRDSKELVSAVEQLGDDASGELSELQVVEIPDGISYEIDEYDGIETIHESHRSWG